jgi:hypothetical protein
MAGHITSVLDTLRNDLDMRDSVARHASSGKLPTFGSMCAPSWLRLCERSIRDHKQTISSGIYPLQT